MLVRVNGERESVQAEVPIVGHEDIREFEKRWFHEQETRLATERRFKPDSGDSRGANHMVMLTTCTVNRSGGRALTGSACLLA